MKFTVTYLTRSKTASGYGPDRHTAVVVVDQDALNRLFRATNLGLWGCGKDRSNPHAAIYALVQDMAQVVAIKPADDSTAEEFAAWEARQQPRWRVMLDMGLQYQSCYVRAHNSVGAMNAAEALVSKRGVAIYDQVRLADDQNGPVDCIEEPGRVNFGDGAYAG